MIIDCATFDARLAPLAMGLLDLDEAAALEAHAARCPACGAALREEQAIESALRDALQVEAPANLTADIKAVLAPRRRWTRWALGAIAAAAVLLLSITWPRPPTSVIEGDAIVLRGGERINVTAATGLEPGDRVQVTTGVAHLEIDGTRVRLRAAEAVVLRTDRGPGPELKLRRGQALVIAPPAAHPFEISTAAGELQSTGGAFDVTLDPEQRDEVIMRGSIALVALTAAATVLIVKALDGDVQVQNAHGTATVKPGARAAAVADAPPNTLKGADAELRKALREARANLARKERAIERLEKQVAQLKSGMDAPDPRPVGEVLAELKSLAKEHGMALYGSITPNHPLFKELQAMGAEGITMLSDLLKTGTDTEKFVAAALMEKLLDPTAIPALSDALFGENKGNLLVQRMSSHALAIIGGEEAIGPLERAMNDGPEWGVKGNAAYGLARMGHEGGVAWLLEAYNTAEDPMIRAVALPAMADIGDPSYLPVMHSLLQEETEYSKRTLALQGIAKAGQKESLPILEALIDDPEADKALLVEAKKAFNAIAGRDAYPVE